MLLRYSVIVGPVEISIAPAPQYLTCANLIWAATQVKQIRKAYRIMTEWPIFDPESKYYIGAPLLR